MIRFMRPRRAVLLTVAGALLAAGLYHVVSGSGGQRASDVIIEPSRVCSTCDARHSKLRDRREAVRKLSEMNQ